MFIAYVKSNINRGDSVEEIKITERKYLLRGKIVFLEAHTKLPNVYVKYDSSLRFHKDHLEGIVDINTNSVAIFIDESGRKLIGFHKHNNNRNDWYKDSATGIEIHKDIMSGRECRSYSYGSYIETEFDREDRVCPECGKTYSHIDGSYVCGDCYNRNRRECRICGRTSLIIDAIKVDGKKMFVCSRCEQNFEVCSKCHEFTEKRVVVEGDIYCVKCACDIPDVVSCKKCGTRFKEDSKHIIQTRNGKYICEICAFDQKTSNLYGGVREYSYRPNPIFYGSGNFFMGVELELVTPYTRIKKDTDTIAKFIQFHVNAEEDFCYCKYDRSVGNQGMNGFEIVTHPFSFDWIQTEGVPYLEKIFDLKKSGCKAFRSNTCGMHVHMSRRAFSNTQLKNFMKFIYLNKDFSLLISERTDMDKVNSYCNFSVSEDIVDEMVDENSPSMISRHSAVHFMSPNTVELRIFRSTLKRERFMKNIEFCMALYIYSKTSYSRDGFIKYIKSNSMYPNLNEFLVKKGF